MKVTKMIKKPKISVVGLGYVGLPLAVEFGKIFPTIGYDINKDRVLKLSSGIDETLECSTLELNTAKLLNYSFEENEISDSNIYIITVPTPINTRKEPDLSPLKNATKLVAKFLNDGDIVIYESTVYPGCTEEICVPILEKQSGLKYKNSDQKVTNNIFYCGYSPERINPGDKSHRVTNIKKVTSGSTDEVAIFIDSLYARIITAGTYMAESIIVAEAAKVIENTQRDINIALINELSIIFSKLNIDTESVLKAAGTKWNFLPFRPGLVGGHCIGVDPYYLTHKSLNIGYKPDIILAGRHMNDEMSKHVSEQMTSVMKSKDIKIESANILIMGITFKENCPDIRNTKVVDVVNELKRAKCNVDIYDPYCSADEVFHEYSLEMKSFPAEKFYDGVIIAVAHDGFKELGIKKIKSFCKKNHVIYDLKYLFDKNFTDIRL